MVLDRVGPEEVVDVVSVDVVLPGVPVEGRSGHNLPQKESEHNSTLLVLATQASKRYTETTGASMSTKKYSALIQAWL